MDRSRIFLENRTIIAKGLGDVYRAMRRIVLEFSSCFVIAHCRRKIRYTDDLQNIIAFADSSRSCKQFTRIDCHHMCLTCDKCGYLVDRRGIPLDYFGGGSPSNGGWYRNFQHPPTIF